MAALIKLEEQKIISEQAMMKDRRRQLFEAGTKVVPFTTLDLVWKKKEFAHGHLCPRQNNSLDLPNGAL